MPINVDPRGAAMFGTRRTNFQEKPSQASMWIPVSSYAQSNVYTTFESTGLL